MKVEGIMKKQLGIFLSAAMVAGALAGCASASGENTNQTEAVNAKTENTEAGGTEGTEGTGTADTEFDYTTSTIPESGLTVRIADLDVWLVAKKAGLLDAEFGDENINFEFTSFNGGAYINEAMAADSVDFGAMWEQPALTAVANDYPETIIATYGYSDTNAPLIATVASGITTLEDFRGKNAKIGVILGGSFHYTALKYLEQVGLTEDDVELLNADTQTMLRSGDIDAAVTFAAYAQPLIDEGTCVQVAIGSDYGLMAVYAFVGNNKFIEAHPDVTVRLLKVLNEAYEYMSGHLEESLQWVADEWQQDYDVLLSTYNVSVFNVDMTQDDIDAMAQVEQFLEDYELIQKHVKISDAVDTKYLKAAGIEVPDLVYPD
jgi:ABC-type nitrate/sulfonate/bicarbonate transport system substrate-binding protein